jgi:hypothetical protein
MRLLLGDDPAMIELTAITSAFGAGHQEFHHDGITSLGQYAQGISHSYSIFIMLQDTTPTMGATGACPGTAKCADGLEQVCEEHGLQPQNSQGFWGTGDALVMNMDRYALSVMDLFEFACIVLSLITNAPMFSHHQLASWIGAYRSGWSRSSHAVRYLYLKTTRLG